MKKERLYLERNLNLVLYEEAVDQAAMKKIEKELLDKGIKSAFKILNKAVPVQTQPLVVLYWLSKSLHDNTKREEVNPDKFFNEKEIEEFKNFKITKEINEFESGYKFGDFVQLTNEVYQGSLEVQEISKLWDRGLATYNKETQRNSVLVKLHSKVIEDVNLNQSAVTQIADLIKKGDFFPVAPIIFNILKDGNEVYTYNEKKKELVFNEGNLNCTDGFHRTMGILAALLDDPEIDLKFPVVITHLTTERARKMIKQESQKNQMDKSYVKSLDSENLENYIIDEINKVGSMKQQITTNADAVKMNRSLIYRDTFEKALKENFNYKNKREARKISQFLSKGLQEIMDIFYEEFKNPEESKKESAVTYSNTFAGYLALLSELYNRDDWANEIEEVLDRIDFSTKNSDWENLKITQTKISNRLIKEIGNKFKKEANHVNEKKAIWKPL